MIKEKYKSYHPSDLKLMKTEVDKIVSNLQIKVSLPDSTLQKILSSKNSDALAEGINDLFLTTDT